jgi:hypothetical protein
MSIAAVGSSPVPPIHAQQTGHKGHKAGNDGDSDDAGAKPPIQAAPTPGTGLVVNKKA